MPDVRVVFPGWGLAFATASMSLCALVMEWSESETCLGWGWSKDVSLRKTQSAEGPLHVGGGRKAQ